jgi:hypothetical protein
VRELEIGDADLVLTILEMRAYVSAKDAIDRAKSPSDVKVTAAVKLAMEVEVEAFKAKRR